MPFEETYNLLNNFQNALKPKSNYQIALAASLIIVFILLIALLHNISYNNERSSFLFYSKIFKLLSIIGLTYGFISSFYFFIRWIVTYFRQIRAIDISNLESKDELINDIGIIAISKFRDIFFNIPYQVWTISSIILCVFLYILIVKFQKKASLAIPFGFSLLSVIIFTFKSVKFIESGKSASLLGFYYAVSPPFPYLEFILLFMSICTSYLIFSAKNEPAVTLINF